MMLLIALATFALLGASDKEAIVWEYENQTCIAINSESKEATDVIVSVVYRSQLFLWSEPTKESVIGKRTEIWRTWITTFPIYYYTSSMGDCAPVDIKTVEKIEVQWLKRIR